MEIDFSPALDSVSQIINSLIARIPYLAVGLLVLVLFYLVANGVRSLVRRLATQAQLSPNAVVVFGKLARWMMILLGLLVTLAIVLPDFDPAELIGLLGVGSIAIGFAFRDILQNFLAGLLLLVTEPFKIGDQIQVGEFEGTVEHIETRATLIRTYDGRRVVIPNADLFTGSVVVNTAFKKRRSEYQVGINYEADIDLAKRLIIEALSDSGIVASDPPPDVLTGELGESAVNLRVRWWSDSRRSKVNRAQDQVLAAIKRKLAENDIDIPFPKSVVLFHDQTRDKNGNRTRQREG